MHQAFQKSLSHLYVDIKLWKIVLSFSSLMFTMNWFALTMLCSYNPGLSWYRQNSPANPLPMEPDSKQKSNLSKSSISWRGVVCGMEFQGQLTGTYSPKRAAVNSQTILHREVIHEHGVTGSRGPPVVGNVSENHRHQVPDLFPRRLQILREIFFLREFLIKLEL